MTRSDSGHGVLLDDQRVIRAGPALDVSARTTHLGPIITIDTGATVDFDRARVTDGGGDFDTALSLSAFVSVRARVGDGGAGGIDWDEFDPEAPAGLRKVGDPTAPFTAHLASDTDPANTMGTRVAILLDATSDSG